LVEVVEDFIPDPVRNTHFTGFNRLGRFDEEITLFGGVKMKTGIKGVHLHNCTIGNNSLIHNVKSYIANYRIGNKIFYYFYQIPIITMTFLKNQLSNFFIGKFTV
jgi:hypothetical protein